MKKTNNLEYNKTNECENLFFGDPNSTYNYLIKTHQSPLNQPCHRK